MPVGWYQGACHHGTSCHNQIFPGCQVLNKNSMSAFIASQDNDLPWHWALTSPPMLPISGLTVFTHASVRQDNFYWNTNLCTVWGARYLLRFNICSGKGVEAELGKWRGQTMTSPWPRKALVKLVENSEKSTAFRLCFFYPKWPCI